MPLDNCAGFTWPIKCGKSIQNGSTPHECSVNQETKRQQTSFPLLANASYSRDAGWVNLHLKYATLTFWDFLPFHFASSCSIFFFFFKLGHACSTWDKSEYAHLPTDWAEPHIITLRWKSAQLRIGILSSLPQNIVTKAEYMIVSNPEHWD